ncbi:peptidase/protease [Phocaeicola vulgatus CAG:6]|jgi:tricorn protease|uniref:S41 family peptidase n=1 Tax=Phocaeicola vulgatus TaxID=821 RepID=UPI00033D0A4E|nr:S41 family peptidase [Phocaeicola vulgatus]MCE9352799.1 PD40 domain-containing protein [Phocaeicola vulgatus]CDF19084.1 peptidase/protease [Phocaeicola vulgatus CAG:6]
MKKLLTCLALSFVAASSYAATPLWLRDVQISPDGTEIAFCYKGDIYKVPANGGTATQLTTQASYECSPIWSPDSKQIAFASDRNGNFDLFVMSADGGAARRLTTHSASEIPSTFTTDGNYILFSASIQDPANSALFPTSAMTELYKVPVTGGRTEQVLGTPAEMVCFDKSGKTFLYQDRKGFEDEWRKHHTSSITRDVWLYDSENGKHTNLTAHAGEDRNPVFAPDGQTVYFLSERDGSTFNVYSFPISSPQSLKTVTHFKTHPVRFLSMGSNGTLCYTYDGEIYTQKQGDKPQKVKIDIIRDDQNTIADLNFSNGATSATVSPDGKQVAFIVRGEVFVTSADYNTTKQITHTPAREAGLTFSPDNRTLAYASERNGNWELYMAKIARKEEANFPNATAIEEEVLLPSDKTERTYPQFSPDGKELAFIEDRNRLMVLNLETKKVRQVTDGSTWFSTGGGFDYSWSPDGKWFTLEFIGNRHDPYSDIGMVSAQGGKIINLTNSGYTSGSPRWVLDGNAILFITERYGMRAHASWGSLNDVMLVFMNQDAYDKFRLSKEDYELQKELEKEQKNTTETKKNDKKKGDNKEKSEEKKEEKVKDIVVELNNIEDRIVRLTPNSSDLGSAIITKDGETLYYLSAFEGGYDLWKMNLRKKDTKLLHKMDAGWANMEMDKDGKNLFLLGSNTMQKMGTDSESLKPISYQAHVKMDLAAERDYMFNHVYKQEQKRFYNLNMHGIDWDAMTKAYRKFLPHIDNNYDFAELLSEYLGELNVSHTGGRFRPQLKGDATATLGLLYDWNHNGKGLLISEVVEKGPFDHARSKVKAGNIIEKIDGQEITPESDYSVLLNGKARKKTLVTLYNPQTKERWEEVVVPVSNGVMSDLLYARWVKQRAADVDKWSNGRLGYVHIESMGDDSFRSVYSDILGKYNNREGIVIDTRFNGGGRLHEDIEILFSGKKYFTQVVRGREACDMPSRRWNKPSIMVQCEANYSNAHGTPWVYSHQKIGKLVGMPVPGTMTSVSWETLQDPTLVFGIPVIGYRLPDGSYLENSQLEPDIKVANSPETVVKGEDTQLKAAVDELLKEIDGK